MPEQKPDPKAAAPVPVAPTVSATPKKTFQDWLTAVDFKKQLEIALPKHLNPEHFVRMVLTQTMKVPRLLECTQESLFKCILDAAAAGLEIDGRRAHLIPFRNNKKQCYEATLIYDYKGLVELCFRSGLISNIHADIARDKDEFEYDTGKITKHRINFREDRGKPFAAYCIIRLKDGSEKAEVMSMDEVDGIRRRSKSASEGPWVTDFLEMSKKTAARRCLKWVPLSAEIREQIEKEEDFIDLVEKDGIQVAKGGLSAAVDGEPDKPKEAETQAPQGSTEQMAAAGVSEERQFTPEERDNLIAKLEEHILNTGIGQRDLLKKSVAEKVVVIESLEYDLLELPTAALALIVEKYVPVPQEAKA